MRKTKIRLSKPEIERVVSNNDISRTANDRVRTIERELSDARRMRDLAIDDNLRLLKGKGVDTKRSFYYDEKGFVVYASKAEIKKAQEDQRAK